MFRNNNLKLKSFKEKEKDSKNYIYFIKNLYRNTIINNISDNCKIILLFFYRIPVKVIMNEYREPNKVNYLLMELWKKF
ncbi:MAG: hypothetical protein ACKA4D_01205 [Candidatus Karelsulcia muelleri]